MTPRTATLTLTLLGLALPGLPGAAGPGPLALEASVAWGAAGGEPGEGAVKQRASLALGPRFRLAAGRTLEANVVVAYTSGGPLPGPAVGGEVVLRMGVGAGVGLGLRLAGLALPDTRAPGATWEPPVLVQPGIVVSFRGARVALRLDAELFVRGDRGADPGLLAGLSWGWAPDRLPPGPTQLPPADQRW
jgi:hypothetical protein